MTLREAMDQRIERVREPIWANPEAYMKLDYVLGGVGPWIHLYDRGTQEAIGEPTPQDVLIYRLDTKSDSLETYIGPCDEHDQKNGGR